ncbi:MAG TPA: ATP-binding protein [Polyangiaceae bacterium]|nr:ATP-binding protein [Polyangiaceae bacterium]
MGERPTSEPSGSDESRDSQVLTRAEIADGVLQALLEGCQVIAEDYTYVYLNETAVAHARMPREELLGRTMMECFPGIESTEMFSRLERCMKERVSERMENEFSYPDGDPGWFELSFVPVPVGVCVLSIDITARKQAERRLRRSDEQLRHAQKMEAVGRLAGGLAHDLNNILTVVLSYTELMLEQLETEHPLRPDIQEVSKAGKRGAELIGQLLSFSRHRGEQHDVLDLNRCVSDVESMLRRMLGAQVEFSFLPTEPLERICADRSQIEQVLANLVVNAHEAMPRGGMLTIETLNATLDDESAALVGLTAGEYVMLVVTDTGAGMDKATVSRIFEPFFTTKGVRGTGLGLSTVFGIVQQSGGGIWVYSEPDAGTTFRIYFPRAEAQVSVRPRPASLPPPRPGTETILLVEDDDQVREVAAAILRRSGYTVLAAEDGGAAILTSERHVGAIDLLLTDVILPKMSGAELVERLAADRPGLRVLFMSGFTDRAAYLHNILAAKAVCMQKPLTPKALARRVRQVLDAKA